MPRIISGTLGGRRIESPPGQDLRPMMDKVRAALFDMLWHLDAIHGRMLDLYSGTGAVGMEALSRGADYADFVEGNPISARTIQQNLTRLGVAEQGRVHQRKVEEVIARPALLGYSGPYDLISVTPPYAQVNFEALVQRLAASTLVGPGSVIVLEHPREVALPDKVGPLTRLRDRRYGGTNLSIYEIPFEDEGEGEEEN